MKVITWKLHRGRIAAVLLLTAALTVLTVGMFLLPERLDARKAAGRPDAAGDEAQRQAFFASYGWKVADRPVTVRETEVPARLNADQLRRQKEAGLKTADYAGQRVKAYTYAVLNHPTGRGDITATVWVKDGLAAAGFLELEQDRLIHGLTWKGSPMEPESAALTAAAEDNCPTD